MTHSGDNARSQYPAPSFSFVVDIDGDIIPFASVLDLDKMASWVGDGPNEPITAEQVAESMGEDVLTRLAQAVNREPSELARDIAADLPEFVDHATPGGTVDAQRTVGGVTIRLTPQAVDDEPSTKAGGHQVGLALELEP